jgi:hypothetical protein
VAGLSGLLASDADRVALTWAASLPELATVTDALAAGRTGQIQREE